MRRRNTPGFTLLELLAVVALGGLLLGAGLLGLRRSGAGTAREAALAQIAARLAEARGLALGRGEAVRLLVHADPAQPQRYLRYLALAVAEPGGWRVCDGGSVLPEGWVILPAVAPGVAGPGAVRRVADDWSRPSGGMLRSTALRGEPMAGAGGEPLLGASGWLVVHFSPGGGVFAGDIVVAQGRRESGMVPATVVCEAPDSVAGVSLSSYGVATFVRDRAAF